MPFARHPFFVTSLNRMGLWIEREFGIARVEFRHVGAPKRSDVPQREFAAYTRTVGAMTHHRSRLRAHGALAIVLGQANVSDDFETVPVQKKEQPLEKHQSA